MSMANSTSPDTSRQSVDAAHARIRQRFELTPAARQVQHAKAHVAAQQAVDQLRESDGADAKKNLATLTSTAFGTRDLTSGASPADQASVAITARDAADRADQLDSPEAALALLQRANAMGDETLGPGPSPRRRTRWGRPGTVPSRSSWRTGRSRAPP